MKATEIIRADEAQAVAEVMSSLIPAGAHGGPRPRVLDVGCGAGRMAQALGARGFEVTGIERSAPQAAQARSWCTRVVEGDVLAPETWAQAGQGYGAVLLSHVLEHVTEPERVLASSKAALAAGGALIAILPNVATWRMRLHLLAGRWEYADEGVLDRTHVRFYTLRSAVRLLEGDTQLELERVVLFQVGSSRPAPARLMLDLVRSLRPLPFTHSFILGARLKPSGAGARHGA